MTRAALLTAVTCATMLCAFPSVSGAATATGTRVLAEEGGPHGIPDIYVLNVRYDAGAGEENRLSVSITGDEIVLQDPGADIATHGECTSNGPHRAVCSSPGDALSEVRVSLGDGDDQFDVDVDEDNSIRVAGGSGNDRLEGGISSEHLDGGTGNDVVDGGEGTDTIVGGEGGDLLRGGEAATEFEHDLIYDGERDGASASDTIVATSGQATLFYTSRRKRVVVDLPARMAGAPGEGDSVTGIRSVVGGSGPDIMYGRRSFDFFRGGPGADRLMGRGGNDLLYGQAGQDRVLGGRGDDVMSDNSDNARDKVACAAGYDFVATSDKRDRLGRNCEDGAWLRSPRLDAPDEVNRIGVQPTLARRRAIFRTTCTGGSNGCSGRITLVTSGRRLPLGRGPIRIKRPRGSDRRHEISVRLNARGRKVVRRGGYVRVVILSRDPCGCLNPKPVKSGFTTWMQR